MPAQQQALLVGGYIMTTISKIFLSFLSLLTLGCDSVTYRTKPLIAKDSTILNEKNNTLLVFVGEKLSINPIPKGGDNGIEAKYKILERIYGDYSKDIIEFKAYDHYETPEFSKYQNALIFLSQYKGEYYEEKYMSSDVHKTKEGRWAGSYAFEDYHHDFNKNTSVKPIKINFLEEISYPTKIIRPDGVEMERTYPSPYFKTVGGRAIAVYGNYVEDLFILKKEGFLTARKLFGDKEIIVKDIELEETTDTSTNKKNSK